MNTKQRLRLAKQGARERNYDTTWTELCAARPGINEGLSEYSERRLAAEFENWLVRARMLRSQFKQQFGQLQ